MKILNTPQNGDKNFVKYTRLLASLIFILTSTALYYLAISLPLDRLIVYENIDAWFGTDIFRVIATETQTENAAHHRNSVHPFYSFITYPANHLLSTIFGIDKITSAVIFHSITGGCLSATIFVSAKRISQSTNAALAITALLLISSSFIFLASVPETFALGALTICVALLIVDSDHLNSLRSSIAIGLLTFSVTITNYGVAIIASFIKLRPRIALLSFVATIVIASLISFAQTVFFPRSGVFYKSVQKEAMYVQLTKRTPEEVVKKVTRRAVVFLSAGFVLENVKIEPNSSSGLLPRVDISPINESTPSAIGFVALIGWWTLLVLAIASCIKKFRSSPTLATALLFYIYQFFLHLLYGDETFIYTLHSIPAVLVMFAGLCKSNGGLHIKALVGITAILTAIINVKTFSLVVDAMR